MVHIDGLNTSLSSPLYRYEDEIHDSFTIKVYEQEIEEIHDSLIIKVSSLSLRT